MTVTKNMEVEDYILVKFTAKKKKKTDFIMLVRYSQIKAHCGQLQEEALGRLHEKRCSK